jgi:glycosyl hydrolase family 26
MNGDPRASRRGLLALAAAAALPAACASTRRPQAVPSAEVSSGIGEPVAAPTTAPPVRTGGGPVRFTPGKIMLGAYVAIHGQTTRSALALRRRQLGRYERIQHRYYAWPEQLPTAMPDLSPGAIPMISWRGTSLTTVTTGAADRLIAAAARRLATHGRPTLLRWAWDMNRDFYSWGGATNGRTAARYVAAWRRMHRVFAGEGATNVSWVWSPNWNSQPDEPWNALENYYPGDDVVDWAGVSGLNDGTSLPGDMFDAFSERYAARKPIMLAEVATVAGPALSAASWVGRLAGWATSHPALGAVVWFDTDVHSGAPVNWRVDAAADTLAAYRAMAVAPAFGG